MNLGLMKPRNPVGYLVPTGRLLAVGELLIGGSIRRTEWPERAFGQPMEKLRTHDTE